jgi:hypothetical protein
LLGDLERLEIEAAIFCEQQSDLLEHEVNVLGSASRLYRNGLSVRLLTHYWSPLSNHLTRLRNTIRSDYMHLPVSDLRK